jgi:DNA-binding MarR family transcriptional regulator
LVNKTDIRNFRSSLRRLEREMQLSLEAQCSCCGVTPAQCHLVLELDANGEETVSGLAEALALDKSTLSRTVEPLRKSGFVACERGGTDRRVVMVSLSAKGKALAAEINGSCDEYYRRALEGLDAKKWKILFEGTGLLGAMMRRIRTETDAEELDA